MHDKLLRQSNLSPENGHRILLIHPNVKHLTLRRKFETGSTPFQKRASQYGPNWEEAHALIDSLEGWTTIGSVVFSLRGVVQGNRARFFTTGVWEEVTKTVEDYRMGRQNDSPRSQDVTPNEANTAGRLTATAVFVNWPRLSTLQIITMQKAWSLPVYDRYTIVVQLFISRARSAKSRLQAQLAQISVLRLRLPTLFLSLTSPETKSFYDGISERQLDQLLKEKEARLIVELSNIEKRDQLSKQQRHTKRIHDLPTVTVVGYTNAGKTSLIRCLSGSLKARSSPQVFATLDITHHQARLPTVPNKDHNLPEMRTGLPGIRFLLLDTIGFMADLPTNLIPAFRSTLEECLDTDLILHVIDISEEGWEKRAAHVHSALSAAGVSLHNSQNARSDLSNSDLAIIRSNSVLSNPPAIIRVGNKADKGLHFVNEFNRQKLDILVSATSSSGLNNLTDRIKETLVRHLGWFKRTVIISQGSSALQWMYSNAMITNIEADEHDSQRLRVSAIFTPAAWQKLQHLFSLRKRI